MEAERRSSTRSKRKPLSDCTNILQTRRKNPSSSSSSSKIPKSQTLIKPSNSTENVTNNKVNHQFPTSSFAKSHTSTGSNTSPTSIPRAPAPPTSFVDVGGTKSGLSSDHNQRNEATRKDKGKMVADTPVFQLPAFLTSKALHISSSAAPDHNSHPGVQGAQSKKLHYDKGKGIVDAPVTTPCILKNLQSSFSVSSGSLPETSAVDSQNLHGETRRDKGKAVVETPNTEAFFTSKSLQISSSGSPGHSSCSGIQAVHSQRIIEKEKGIVDPPVIQLAAPYVSKYLQSSPSVTSGSLSETSASHSQKLHEETRKDKGKMVVETLNAEAYEPSTPHGPHVSIAVAASGTRQKPVTVYRQRRVHQGRKHGAGKINVSLSCPPDQRMKKTGLRLDYDQVDGKSGSHTDPRPVHKKKQSCNKDGGSMHVMPQEEVEKLRAYYADIDAFELPEEVASKNELE